jgi:hypothetical protein
VSVYSVLILRNSSIKYIINNREIYSLFITDIDTFLDKQIVSGEWVTYETLIAMSHVVKRNFVVIKDINEQDYCSNLFDDSRFPPILVAHENSNHFCVLYPRIGEIITGYPKDAPKISFLKDTSLSLNFLQGITKYNHSKRAQYPFLLAPLQPKPNLNLSFQKKILPKKYIQPILKFSKPIQIIPKIRVTRERFKILFNILFF